MKNLFNFSEKHSKLFLGMWVIKSIVTPLISIIVFLLLLHMLHPVTAVQGFESTQQEYEQRQREMVATEKYMNGETDDTTDVPESVIASKKANEQANAQIEQAFDMMQQH